MAQIFIERPSFAWVVALFHHGRGAVSITQLPIAQYPPVAPDRLRERGLPPEPLHRPSKTVCSLLLSGRWTDDRPALHGVRCPIQRHRLRHRQL